MSATPDNIGGTDSIVPDVTVATNDLERETAFHGTIECKITASVEGDGYLVPDSRLNWEQAETVLQSAKERWGEFPDESPHRVIGTVAYDVFRDKVVAFRESNA
jgi:hypothetical protein